MPINKSRPQPHPKKSRIHILCLLAFLAVSSASCDVDSTNPSRLAESSQDKLNQCEYPIGTCEWYSECLEIVNPCGQSQYALSFGLPYCKRFSNINFYTAKANIWRDHVRTCLQEQIVTAFEGRDQIACDELTTFAFDSHVGCYLGEPSICELSYFDSFKVMSTLKSSEIFNPEIRRQIRKVSRACIWGT